MDKRLAMKCLRLAIHENDLHFIPTPDVHLLTCVDGLNKKTGHWLRADAYNIQEFDHYNTNAQSEDKMNSLILWAFDVQIFVTLYLPPQPSRIMSSIIVWKDNVKIIGTRFHGFKDEL
jgi:hypothetical protein